MLTFWLFIFMFKCNNNDIIFDEINSRVIAVCVNGQININNNNKFTKDFLDFIDYNSECVRYISFNNNTTTDYIFDYLQLKWRLFSFSATSQTEQLIFNMKQTSIITENEYIKMNEQFGIDVSNEKYNNRIRLHNKRYAISDDAPCNKSFCLYINKYINIRLKKKRNYLIFKNKRDIKYIIRSRECEKKVKI